MTMQVAFQKKVSYLVLQHNISTYVTFFIDKCESCHQLNLKKSVLENVVKVLESSKVQEMELAQEVREMMSGSRSPRVGSEDLPTTPPRTRFVLYSYHDFPV